MVLFKLNEKNSLPLGLGPPEDLRKDPGDLQRDGCPG